MPQDAHGAPWRLRIVVTMAAALVLAAVWIAHGSLQFRHRHATRHFDIDAKPLAEALMDVGVQGGVLVIAPTSLTAGKEGNALHGEVTAEAALSTVLRGSGLAFARVDEGSFLIQRLPGLRRFSENAPAPTE